MLQMSYLAVISRAQIYERHFSLEPVTEYETTLSRRMLRHVTPSSHNEFHTKTTVMARTSSDMLLRWHDQRNLRAGTSERLNR